MKSIVIRTNSVGPIKKGRDQATLVVTRKKAVVVDIDTTESFLSVDRSRKFSFCPSDSNVQERKGIVFFFFNSKSDVGMT